NDTRRVLTPPWRAASCGRKEAGVRHAERVGAPAAWSLWGGVAVCLAQLVPSAAFAGAPALEPAAVHRDGEALSQENRPSAVPNIALVRSPGDQAIALRLAAELDALGYRVVEITGPATLSPLVELARDHDVDALLRSTPSRTGIELVVVLPAGLDAERPEGG